jgi:hypothetical protein
VSAGANSLFVGDSVAERGGFLLDVIAGGVPTRVAGGEIPTVEENRPRDRRTAGERGRLSVTRKVFVPRAGYFARYLELLRNPTEAPITVDLRVLSHPSGAGLAVESTSSGDTAVDVSDPATADRWVAFGRTEAHGLAFVFDGPDAAARAGAVTLSMHATSPTFGRFSCLWPGLTIEPGATVAILHFGVQQLSRAAAVASAERLVQLPPEALAGLTEEELAAVRNFALPAGGVSALAPLPSLTGTVTGVVREGDETTPVTSAQVRFKSANVLFGGTVTSSSGVAGAFTFTGQLLDNGNSRAVPVDDFTLQATYPSTTVNSPVIAASFPGSAATAVADVTFSNTGAVFGVVRRHTGTAVTSGSIQITNGTDTRSTSIAADSTYRVGGLLPGTYTLTATIPNPGGSGGTGLVGHTTVTVTAGAPQRADVSIDPTGALTGVVRRAGGAVVVNRSVTVQRSGFSRSIATNSGGAYTFADLPTGTFTVSVNEPSAGIAVSAPVTIAADQVTTQNLTYVPIGSVAVQVRYQNDAPASSSSVTLTYTTLTGQGVRSLTTDAAGFVTFDDILGGPFTVVARHPKSSSFTAQGTGEITQDDVPVPVSLTLPALGTVRVQVSRGADVPVANSPVTLDQPGRTTQSATSAANGRATFNIVPAGPFTARARHPENQNLNATTTGTLTGEGQVVDVSVTLPAIGAVTGTVKMPDGSVVASVIVTLKSTNPAISTKTATTNAQGVYGISGVPAGAYTASVDDAARAVFGSAPGQITTDGATVTTDIVLAGTIVNLPIDLFDGNAFRFDIQRNGSLSDGSNDAYDGGLNLRLFTPAGAASSFPNAVQGRTEDTGREVAIKGTGMAGLEVTRKIFVPADGYFARYLEVLTNPGTVAVTVDAEISTNLGSKFETQVVATSSGDSTFAPNDFWIVTDDADGSGDPTLAHVMGGPGAARALASVTRLNGLLLYRWNGVTVAPGQSVILMHFASQEFDRQKSRFVAERLVQLPPEALAGLSVDEIAQIANFAVPADGSSPLEETHRPPAATVTGHVLGSDGQAPVAGALVTLTSQNPVFGTALTTTSAADGGFTVANALADAFTVTARHPKTNVVAPPVAGTFEPGQTTATADVVFSNTGTIRGVVRRHAGQPVTAGSIVSPYPAPLAADGRLRPHRPHGRHPGPGHAEHRSVPDPEQDGGSDDRADHYCRLHAAGAGQHRGHGAQAFGRPRGRRARPHRGRELDRGGYGDRCRRPLRLHRPVRGVSRARHRLRAGAADGPRAEPPGDDRRRPDGDARLRPPRGRDRARPRARRRRQPAPERRSRVAPLHGNGLHLLRLHGDGRVPGRAEGSGRRLRRTIVLSRIPVFQPGRRRRAVRRRRPGGGHRRGPVFGSVQGYVYAADGTTALPGIYVEVVDAATGNGLTSLPTDDAGHYATSSFSLAETASAPACRTRPATSASSVSATSRPPARWSLRTSRCRSR